MSNEGMVISNDVTLIDGKMTSRMSMTLPRYLAKTL